MPTRLRIDRTQLHEMVWSAPISSLARRFGPSDAGLAKLCKRFGVPIPSRGYWARVSTGRTPERRPLPLPERGEDRAVTLEEYSPDEVVERSARRARFAETRKALRWQPVALETGAIERSVRRAKAALSACKRDYNGLRKSPPNVLEVEVQTWGELLIDERAASASRHINAISIASPSTPIVGIDPTEAPPPTVTDCSVRVEQLFGIGGTNCGHNAYRKVY